MRPKFVITESEREEIKKLYNIQEQLRIGSYKESKGGGIYELSTNKTPAYIYAVNTYKTPEAYAKFLNLKFDPNTGQFDESTPRGAELKKIEQKMLSIMDPKSQEVWNTIPQKNPIFYMYALLHYSGNWNLGKRSKMVVDNKVTIKETPVSTPGEPKDGVDVDGVEMTTKGAQQPTLFVINEPILTDEFKQFLTQNIINVVKDNIAEASKISKVSSVHIGKLYVTSSCSSAPNKQSKTFGKVPSFLELSKARGEVVYNFIIESLKGIGVPVTYSQDQNVMGVNFKGTNGDGTSGPTWAEVTASGGDYKSVQQYQRADVDFLYGVVTERHKQEGPSEDGPSSDVIPQKTEDFLIRLTEKGRTRRRFYINYTPKTRIPNARKRLKCPVRF